MENTLHPAAAPLWTTKPRYEILDGLRGVAALIVLTYHLFEVLGGGITSFHGYLAVDFFFILSGFVTGYAYDDRWHSMTLGQFFRRRLTRLHPMVLMGTLMGTLLFYFGMSDALPQIRQAHWPGILACVVFACIMVPTPHSLDVRGWQEFNCLNGNSWTLTFEYLANLIYALIVRHFNKLALAVLVACSAILTVGIGLGFDLFGVMGARPAEQFHTFIGGWSTDPDQLVVGFGRLFCPFFMGLLMARCMRSPHTGAGRCHTVLRGHGFLLATVLLAIVLLTPSWGGTMWNGAYEVACILLVFPLAVWVGAQGTVSGRVGKFCKWLGDISYPLYITHYPIVFTLCLGWHANNPTATLDQVCFVAFCAAVLSLMVAWASLRLWDEPVRRWLHHHFVAGRRA